MCKIITSTCPSGSAAGLRFQILNHVQFALHELCAQHAESSVALFERQLTWMEDLEHDDGQSEHEADQSNLLWGAHSARADTMLCRDLQLVHRDIQGACQRCDDVIVANNWKGMSMSDLQASIPRRPVGSPSSSSPSLASPRHTPSSSPSPPPPPPPPRRPTTSPDDLGGWVQHSYRREYTSNVSERVVESRVEQRRQPPPPSPPARGPSMPGTFPHHHRHQRHNDDGDDNNDRCRRSRSPSRQPQPPTTPSPPVRRRPVPSPSRTTPPPPPSPVDPAAWQAHIQAQDAQIRDLNSRLARQEEFVRRWMSGVLRDEDVGF